MNLDRISISKLARIIEGLQINDGYKIKNITPDTNGHELVEMFITYFGEDAGFNLISDWAIENKKRVKHYKRLFTESRYLEYLENLKNKENSVEGILLRLNKTENLEKALNNFMYSRLYLQTEYDVDEIAKYINEIIEFDGYKLKKIDDEYAVTKKEYKEVIPVFQDIQYQIINEIRKAKYTIWVAVAWFTDDSLLQELIEKQKQGVNVQIIVCNDEVTKAHGLNYEDYFETYKINPFGVYNNIFHEKFCVIDLETVIHGSYNWTKKAQYNKESISTIRSKKHAEKYADRFIELKIMNK